MEFLVRYIIFICIFYRSIALTEHLINSTNPFHCIKNENEISLNEYRPTVYWINLDNNIKRKRYMESQLNDLNYRHKRISAITPTSLLFNLDKLEKPCGRNTNKDIAVILSHLYAWYTAINDAEDQSDYALIIEDDIRFVYYIDYLKLISSKPSDANILQLITSNQEAITNLWASYDISDNITHWTHNEWQLTARGGKHALFWSAQAYLIYKPAIRKILHYIITPIMNDFPLNLLNSTNYSLKFKIINSFSIQTCLFQLERPCVLANCLFADTYLYSLGGPTYVTSIPFFNGGIIGHISEIHQDHVPIHKHAFQTIHNIVKELKNNTQNYKHIYNSNSNSNSNSYSHKLIDNSKKILPNYLQFICKI